MERLNFPKIKGKMPRAKSLSMDDYLKFVKMNIRHTLDMAAYRKQKRLFSVNVPFSLTG